MFGFVYFKSQREYQLVRRAVVQAIDNAQHILQIIEAKDRKRPYDVKCAENRVDEIELYSEFLRRIDFYHNLH